MLDDIRRAAEVMEVIEMSQDKAELFAQYWNMLVHHIPAPESEYNFDKQLGRKHRFDFAFPNKLIAVEIDGNAWNVKGGGRHIQDADLEKYNIAASLGWRIFRFSPSMLKRDPAGCIQTVVEAVCLTKPNLPDAVAYSVSAVVEKKDTTRITPSSTTSKRKAGRNIKNSTTPVISS